MGCLTVGQKGDITPKVGERKLGRVTEENDSNHDLYVCNEAWTDW